MFTKMKKKKKKYVIKEASDSLGVGYFGAF